MREDGRKQGVHKGQLQHALVAILDEHQPHTLQAGRGREGGRKGGEGGREGREGRGGEGREGRGGEGGEGRGGEGRGGRGRSSGEAGLFTSERRSLLPPLPTGVACLPTTIH